MNEFVNNFLALRRAILFRFVPSRLLASWLVYWSEPVHTKYHRKEEKNKTKQNIEEYTVCIFFKLKKLK